MLLARLGMVAVVAAGLLVTLVPETAPSGGDTGSADLATALLVAEDLPADMMSAAGVTHEPAFDIDQTSYESNGGLDTVAQTWQASDVAARDPVVIVFDFRFLFPSADDAQAYLDAAEPILSESATGITLQPETPTVGEVLHNYAGSISQGGVTVDVQNFLFRTGPVVAKVYIGGFGTTLDDALPIAQAAAERIDAWLAEQPTESPSASTGAAGSAGPAGSLLSQWASGATASSQYGADEWSAEQATGAPDVASYGDDPRAWAPATKDGNTEWLELEYGQTVVPSAVTIVESFGNGAVTLIEAFNAEAGAWVRLWSGNDTSPPDTITALSPDIATVTFATSRLRITLDTEVIPGWNEIDAVELIGTLP